MKRTARYSAIALMASACGVESWSFDRDAGLADADGKDAMVSFRENPDPADAADDAAADASEGDSHLADRVGSDALPTCAFEGGCFAEPPPCGEAGGSCPHCGADDNCADASGGPACDMTTGRCVQCTSDVQCGSPPLRRCEPSSHACVQCLSNADCAVDSSCDPATRVCKHR